MSNLPITSLPVAISLTGSETVAGVQAGTTKQIPVSLINSTNPANIPIGGLTGQGLVKQSNANYDMKWATVAGFGTVQEVDTGTGLTGGPITLMGTIALASIAAGRVLANVTGGSAAPIANTPSSVLDLIGSTRGQLLYRGASGWSALGPGSAGQILTTGGVGADPAWAAVGSGTVTSVGLSLPAIFSVSGSPVTTSGTLTGTLANQSANMVWAGPTTGAAAAPTFRSLVGADLPNPSASTLGGVQSYAGTASQWIRSISTSGVPASSQPAFSDISGQATGAQLPNPSPTTLGGIQSLAAVSSRWINQISTAGVPSATQPAFSDLSGVISTAQLPPAGNNTVLANTSGGSTAPIPTAPSTVLDIIGSTQGQLLYRNASAWVPLLPGTSGQVLTTGGGAANPTWTTVTGTGTVTDIAAGTGISTGGSDITTTGTVSLAAIASQRILANITGGSAAPIANTMTSLLDIIGSTQGQVLYRGASNWTALSAGTSGQFLQTLGAGSTPQWAAAVVGPGGATNNGFAVYNGTTGALIKDHAATISLTTEVSGTLPTANGGLGNTAGAWTAYTPTPVPGSGSFTSASAAGGYYVIGKLVHYTVTITITTVGSAAGIMTLALPTGVANRAAVGVCEDTNATGKMGICRIAAGGTSMLIQQYDTASMIAVTTITCTGIYEQT